MWLMPRGLYFWSLSGLRLRNTYREYREFQLSCRRIDRDIFVRRVTLKNIRWYFRHARMWTVPWTLDTIFLRLSYAQVSLRKIKICSREIENFRRTTFQKARAQWACALQNKKFSFFELMIIDQNRCQHQRTAMPITLACYFPVEKSLFMPIELRSDSMHQLSEDWNERFRSERHSSWCPPPFQGKPVLFCQTAN